RLADIIVPTNGNLGNGDGPTAGEVVITGSGLAELEWDAALDVIGHLPALGHHGDAFEHACDRRGREDVIPMAALREAREETETGHLGEVLRRGRRRHAGDIGELRGGERAMPEERDEHASTRRLPNERSDPSEIGFHVYRLSTPPPAML